MACRVAKTREWTTRLFHESLYHADNCFITITFRDEDLPADRSLSKRTLQLFIKRLRKKIGVKIKYYAVGEYGDRFEREHYHLLIFGWKPPFEDLYFAYRKKGKNYYASRTISVIWTYGFNTVGNVTRDSCQYVAGYVRKKISGKGQYSKYGKRLPPFALQSTGIGACYAFENRDRLQEHLCVVEGGKNVGLPRYYQRILDIDTERLLMKRYANDAQVLSSLVDAGYSRCEIDRLLIEAFEQKDINFTAQEKLRS